MANTNTVTSAKRRKVEPKRSNRSHASSSSSDSDDDKAAMLAALQAHSRAMFGLDGPDEAESSQTAARTVKSSEDADSEDEDDSAAKYDSDDGWGEGDEMVSDSEEEDSEVTDQKVTSPRVPEVVFAETGRSAAPAAVSNSERRAFLKGTTAKMMGIVATPDFIPRRQQKALGADDDKSDGEGEAETSNLKLDKTLHDMLLTTLLPSSDALYAQRPVDKRKAINGRLLELASYHLPGEGSKSLRESELSTHSAKIRTGMMHAKSRRDQKAQAEAEASGSFVRGLGGLGGEGRGFKREKGRGERAALGEEVGKKKGMAGRKDLKRERGLGSGFGKYQGGMLKLSERDIARGSAPSGASRGPGGGKKRRR